MHELSNHNCLTFSSDGSQRGWTFRENGKNVLLKVEGNMVCNDGAVLHDWALAGKGLAWRSMWEVGSEIEQGKLVTVLDEYTAPETTSMPSSLSVAICHCVFALLLTICARPIVSRTTGNIEFKNLNNLQRK